MKKTWIALGTIFATGALATAMTVSVLAAQITEEKARSIALEHAGVKAEDVAFMNTQYDFEHGRLVYEVEFLTSDYKEYDYEIDKDTGAILSWDLDAEYDFLAQVSPQAGANGSLSGAGTAAAAVDPAGAKAAANPESARTAVDLEGAKAAALRYAGLAATDVTWGKVEQDWDDGRVIYEGTFYHSFMEYEFEVDAASGTVIDWEVESIFD